MKIKVPNIISLWVEKYYPLLFTIVICVLLYVFRSMPVINYLYISVYDDTFLTAIEYNLWLFIDSFNYVIPVSFSSC